ncbi:MAG TPA: two-component regulator propeller domain-containing protein, partial [Pyrinomonadaceae bacterium]|nr:two-component regulator propeller domain-containing protein [Pyrinomonadaceae bacterium]
MNERSGRDFGARPGWSCRPAWRAWLCYLLLSTAASVDNAQYRFDSWTTDNGLPQVSVNSILQTRDGFLWLTTFGGLVRY